MRARTLVLLAITVVLATALRAQPGRRRALLIGINDYSASRFAKPQAAASMRGVRNLDGAVNDVETMRDLLVALYAFKPADVVTLTDQQASRIAILEAVERQLVAPAQKDDVVFFYFSGHGSQVKNSRSSEADGFDESLVPADSRHGTDDIRDKELARLFNRILDRGARLTVVLDACHSGSGVRGLAGGFGPRGIKPDLRDVRDPADVPRPERRGALVLSATQDFDLAFETMDENGTIRGAFTWALARAVRDAGPGEPASDTFLRTRARLQAERPAQDPVMAGNAEARARPFLGVRTDRRNHRVVIAVEKPLGSGKYRLQGGWVNGVTTGSELRLVDRDDIRIEVTALLGMTRSEARVSRGDATLQPGSLVEVIAWAAPPTQPLRVWIPQTQEDAGPAARTFREQAARRGIRWIDDPTEATPTHLLRWRGHTWELLADDPGSNLTPERVTRLLASIAPGASLFVQLPAPSALRDAIGSIDGVELASGPEAADYILAGRLTGDRAEYAWVQPLAIASDGARSALPVRSAWTSEYAGPALRDALMRLRRVQAWHDLSSPDTAHYRIAIRRAGDGTLVDDKRLVGKDRYRLVLRRSQQATGPLYPRFFYAFVIDSHGNSVLLFPLHDDGAVENRLPFTDRPGQPLEQPPEEIPLPKAGKFRVTEPYGVDTYFLLSTDEPLHSLACLEWGGVRAVREPAKTPLEELLTSLDRTRAPNETIRTPANWSIDKVIFESIPPRRAAR